MSETENDETSMAECGNCRAVILSNSSECSECKIKFSGLSEDALGECGACGTLVPLESTSCKKCGVIFVADDVMDVLRKWLANTGLSIASLFDKFDTNGDGRIDSDELRQGLLGLNLADLPPSQVDRLIEEIDIDGDGKIDLAELEKSVTGAEYAPSTDEKEDDSEVESEEDDDSDSDPEETEEKDDDSDSDSEETDDDSEDDDSDSDSEKTEEKDDDSELAEEEIEDDDSEEKGNVEFDLNQHKPDDILELLINIMDEREANPAEMFHVLDEDGDKFVSSEEFSNTVGEILEDEDISEESIADFIASLDTDKDGNIDIIEFISAIETKEKDSEKIPKEFPSPMQSAMITKKWNDVWWPLIHAAFFAFILIWVVNGLGLIVDGSGGPVALETSYGMGSGDLSEGDIYPCDAEIQVDNCANSLTPFSGEASSMPKGFHADGIFFIILGVMGMVGSMFTHLVLAKGWRARVKAMKEVESDTEDAKEASDDEDEDDSNSDEEENDDSVSDEDVSEDEGDDSEDDNDDSDDEEDDIDVGSHIGLTVDEEEYFGTIIEFDDEDDLVTIKEDGTGDEITGYQDEMFLE
jgi:Ca2+-binding EF-hand superfamily protein